MLPYNDGLAAAVEAYFKSSNPTLYSTRKLWINSCNSCDENFVLQHEVSGKQNLCLFWSNVQTLDARVLQELQLLWMFLHQALTIQVLLIDGKPLFYATTQEIWLRVANATFWTHRTNASRAQDRLCMWPSWRNSFLCRCQRSESSNNKTPCLNLTGDLLEMNTSTSAVLKVLKQMRKLLSRSTV